MVSSTSSKGIAEVIGLDQGCDSGSPRNDGAGVPPATTAAMPSATKEPCPALRLDHAHRFQQLIGLGRRVAVDAHLGGELTDRRQLVAQGAARAAR